MASIEQKRADLEKALQAIDPNEMEAVAGGLSRGAKIALRLGGSLVAGALGGAAVGAGIYYATKHNQTSPQQTNDSPQQTNDSYQQTNDSYQPRHTGLIGRWLDDVDSPDLPPGAR